jgi:hypothetical protein
MITSKGLEQLGFTPEIDFVLQDNSDGALMADGSREPNVFIAKWNSASPQPTEQVIETAHDLWVTENENAIAQKAADKASANAKLKALGLTDAEIEAIK